jgi:hypothetical protein
MRLRETMICWNPSGMRGQHGLADEWVRLGPHPDRYDWSRGFCFSDGACWFAWREYPDDKRLLRLFVLLTIMMVGDGVPPDAVHRAFLAIDEYRDALPPDVPGARREP